MDIFSGYATKHLKIVKQTVVLYTTEDFRNQSVIFVLSNGLDGMGTPDIESSTREERLEFVRNEFRCLGNCPICGKCSFLRGREAEDLYADYIEGRRSFRDITAEHRNTATGN